MAIGRKVRPKKTNKAKETLGLGVKALLQDIESEMEKNEEAVVKTLSNTVAMLPITEIAVNPEQPRSHFDQEALEDLAQSIKTFGLIQPITVRRLADKEYQIISGERRWRASQIAELEEIPAYIRLANSDQEMLEMALVENIQREELNAIEIALTYGSLYKEFDMSHEEIARRVGKKRSTVSNYMSLLTLPDNVQKALKERTIAMGHARELARIDDPAVQDIILNEIIEKGLSVRATEELAKSHKAPKKSKPKTRLPDAYHRAQTDLWDYFGTKAVKISIKPNGKGQVVIPFDSNNNEQLNLLLDLLNK